MVRIYCMPPDNIRNTVQQIKIRGLKCNPHNIGVIYPIPDDAYSYIFQAKNDIHGIYLHM